ncbi:3795_t:CDS:2 [Funneliformis mosseae]|uniref:3795_t:CDS:1 n=1 Tax=Funneliformis mosseae TaxID=27381 RepID=A0A9N9CWZ0_FUNMO|nr:3795_t:CDS:2 [Funneliformis mosseae]
MSNKADPYDYMEGFGNHFTSEALKDALPKGQNTKMSIRPLRRTAFRNCVYSRP